MSVGWSRGSSPPGGASHRASRGGGAGGTAEAAVARTQAGAAAAGAGRPQGRATCCRASPKAPAPNGRRRERVNGVSFISGSQGNQRKVWCTAGETHATRHKGRDHVLRPLRRKHLLSCCLLLSRSKVYKNGTRIVPCRHTYCFVATHLSLHICRYTFVATHLSPHICRHTFVATHLSPQHRPCNISLPATSYTSCNIEQVSNDPLYSSAGFFLVLSVLNGV